MMNVLYIGSLVLLLGLVSAEDTQTPDNGLTIKPECISKTDLEATENVIVKELEQIFPSEQGSWTQLEGRGKKKHKLSKYVLPLLIGFVLIKSILLPIALKALAVLSGKAVILSLMSLILAAIVGLKKVTHSGDKTVDIVTVPLSKYRRKDMLYDWEEAESVDDPYPYYRERPVDAPRKTKYDKT